MVRYDELFFKKVKKTNILQDSKFTHMSKSHLLALFPPHFFVIFFLFPFLFCSFPFHCYYAKKNLFSCLRTHLIHKGKLETIGEKKRSQMTKKKDCRRDEMAYNVIKLKTDRIRSTAKSKDKDLINGVSDNGIHLVLLCQCC